MASDERVDPATAAARSMRADARRNYDRLLETAREAFAEHGPDAPLDDIARRAGVGAGTLYRHFPHRKALIEAVYRDEIGTVGSRAHELAEAYPPGEALEIWIHDLVQFSCNRRGLATTLKAVLDEESETFAWCKKTSGEAAALLVGNAQAAGVIRQDVKPRDVLLLAHGVAAAVERTPEIADRLVSVLVDGLRAKAVDAS